MKVGIIGTGKVAHKLAYAIDNCTDYELAFISGRSPVGVKQLVKHTSCEFYTFPQYELPPTDIVILAVTDDAISEVANQLSVDNSILVHTSGIKDLATLQSVEKRGILYPLYSFYDKQPQSMDEVPFLIEADNKEDLVTINNLALALSSKVYEVRSDDKKQLHLAAVFANNFGNFMMTNAFDLLESKSIDKEILLPIIRQSCMNWMAGEALTKQSGPAIRRDKKTLSEHNEHLTSQEQQDLYNTISQAIIKFYQ